MFVRQKQSVEPLDTYIFSMIKRLYYGDLCERMTESRDLLMVTYDFIRLFRNGQIKSNDISAILQDVQNTYEILSFLLFFINKIFIFFLSVPMGNNTHETERQQKIKILKRLQFHMAKQNSQISYIQVNFYHSILI